MPYEILKLFSPTHRLRRKITDCIAMIELIDNILSITLKTTNLPWILNKISDQYGENSEACILTFYPKFEINNFLSILTLLKTRSSMHFDRLFTCSIGDISNKHQLKQLANQSYGVVVYVQYLIQIIVQNRK